MKKVKEYVDKNKEYKEMQIIKPLKEILKREEIII